MTIFFLFKYERKPKLLQYWVRVTLQYVCHMSKAVQTMWGVSDVIGSIVVEGALTHLHCLLCELLEYCTVQPILIRELRRYVFGHGDYAGEAANIFLVQKVKAQFIILS